MIQKTRKPVLLGMVSIAVAMIALSESTASAGSLGFSVGFRGGGAHHSARFGHHRAGPRRQFGRHGFGSHRRFRQARFRYPTHSGYRGFDHRGRFGGPRPPAFRGYSHYKGKYGRYPRPYGYTGYYSYGTIYGATGGYYSGFVPYGYYYGQSSVLPGTIGGDRVLEDASRQDPWLLLAEGRFQSARRLFAEEADRFPARGMPKLGYSLASALDGDLERAERAMRGAFRAEPESLGAVSMDPLVMRRLDSVISYYEDSLRFRTTEPDAAFMLAAFRFIDQDFKRAADYVRLAIESGDLDASTLKLKQQLFVTD